MEKEQLSNDDERVAKMDADKFYTSKGGKYLKGVDIAGCEWEVTIKEAFEDKDFNGHPAVGLSFEEIDQTLTLNKTNYLNVKANMGTSETKQWINRKIILYGDRDQNPEGRIVDVVRVRPPAQEVKRTVPGKSKGPTLKYDERNPPPLPDDEVPF